MDLFKFFNKKFALVGILSTISINGIFAQEASFSVKNTTNISRQNELVTISRKTIMSKFGSPITKEEILRLWEGKNSIPCQLIDQDQDGNWDEMVFLVNIQPLQTRKFLLYKEHSNNIKTLNDTVYAHVRMKLKDSIGQFGPSVDHLDMPFQNPPTDFSKEKLPPYLTEGPGWENQKNGFRLYFDTRNTIDIYGKRIPGMVMDTVGTNPTNSYHKLSDWGMDILHVVKSLGAGSLAIRTKDLNGKDTLIRLGGKNIQKESYQQISNGPLFASFRMNYSWEVNNKPVSIIQDFYIWGSEYYYKSDVTITGLPEGSILYAGIGDFFENKLDTFYSNKYAITSSFGKQSENKDELGMAIAIPRKSFANFKEAPKQNSDIMETHMIGQYITENQKMPYYFFSCWSKTNEKFNSSTQFHSFLNEEFKKIENPLTIKWSK